jgi:hypothetical protein
MLGRACLYSYILPFKLLYSLSRFYMLDFSGFNLKLDTLVAKEKSFKLEVLTVQ